jgi:hypothetical protein
MHLSLELTPWLSVWTSTSWTSTSAAICLFLPLFSFFFSGEVVAFALQVRQGDHPASSHPEVIVLKAQ